MKKTIGWSALALFVVCVIAPFVYFFVAKPVVSCEQKILSEFASPSKGRKAVVIRNSCGATTKFRYSVVTVDTNVDIDFSKDYFFSMEGSDDIKVTWNNEYSINLEYGKPSKIFRQAIIWGGEPISYRER